MEVPEHEIHHREKDEQENEAVEQHQRLSPLFKRSERSAGARMSAIARLPASLKWVGVGKEVTLSGQA